MSTELRELLPDNYLGTMCIIDNRFVWCSYSEELFSLLLGDLKMLVLLDNSIIQNNGHCELEGQCFNYECEYNTDKNISVHKKMIKHRFTDERIMWIRKNLKKMTHAIHNDENDPTLVADLNNGKLIFDVFIWDD